MGERQTPYYRPDIDGLRAIAVLAVIFGHLGWLPNGYLGVDVFFVISGYLITGIIQRELATGTFTLAAFYERRVRRIVPLALTVGTVALVCGAFVMLPDDLENLAQSVIATNLFANNVLQAITTKNYWDVVNEYKPLMHTWSLGVEEQFYLTWPFLLALVYRCNPRLLLPVVMTVAAGSLLLLTLPVPDHVKFYHLPFRCFELAAGGVVALGQLGRAWTLRAPNVGVITILLLLMAPVALPSWAGILIAVLASSLVVARTSVPGAMHTTLLEHPVTVFVGLISFSLYMWHQVVFSFARYALVENVAGVSAVVCLAAILGLSIGTYYCVEQPLRRRGSTSVRTLSVLVLVLLACSTGVAATMYLRGGVIRDVPEFDIVTTEAAPGMHRRYNDRVRALDREFETSRLRVLIVGNSFARDWANVLLESEWADRIEVSYLPREAGQGIGSSPRLESADVVFWTAATPETLRELGTLARKTIVLGPKNFGESAGIFYTRLRNGRAGHAQRVRPMASVLSANDELRAAAGERFVDLMAPMMAADGTVPVFTPDGKFITRDCRHLTKAGALFYASVMAPEIDRILRVAVARAQRPVPS